MTLRFPGIGALVLLIAAAPAFGQSTPSKTSPGAPPAKTAPAPPPPKPLFSPIPPAKSPEQCRTGCAQTYYFCLAENEMQDCAPQWSQCRLTCNATATTGR